MSRARIPKPKHIKSANTRGPKLSVSRSTSRPPEPPVNPEGLARGVYVTKDCNSLPGLDAYCVVDSTQQTVLELRFSRAFGEHGIVAALREWLAAGDPAIETRTNAPLRVVK